MQSKALHNYAYRINALHNYAYYKQFNSNALSNALHNSPY